MFAGLINRAQATVDNAIGQIVNRAIIAMPFIIALGFGTAYGFLRLQREFDTETATLAMALGFSVLGLFAALILGRGGRTSEASAANTAAEETATATAGASTEAPAAGIGAADKELLIAALTTAGPIALPSIVRLLMKNLPIVAALVALLFVMTRSAPDGVSAASTPSEAN